jgi:hypothetical protein
MWIFTDNKSALSQTVMKDDKGESAIQAAMAKAQKFGQKFVMPSPYRPPDRDLPGRRMEVGVLKSDGAKGTNPRHFVSCRPPILPSIWPEVGSDSR